MLLANAPEETKLGGTQGIFRPLGVLGPGLSGDNSGNAAPSTSPSNALFAKPLFQGLPKLPDGSPEDQTAAEANSKA